jgi:hypothetical protein
VIIDEQNIIYFQVCLQRSEFEKMYHHRQYRYHSNTMVNSDDNNASNGIAIFLCFGHPLKVINYLTHENKKVP